MLGPQRSFVETRACDATGANPKQVPVGRSENHRS
jgi:hypothetical protein